MTILFTLLIYLLVLGILLSLIWYVLGAIPVPDPPRRWIWLAVIVISGLIVISLLLGALGGPDFGLPRFR